MLSAKDILDAGDTKERQRVEVPEWGGHVYVKIMTGAERDRWELSATEQLKTPTTANIRATLCLFTICDNKGERLFGDDQLGELGQKSAIALERVFQAARKINRINDNDVEELEKNLEPAVRAVSGSS